MPLRRADAAANAFFPSPPHSVLEPSTNPIYGVCLYHCEWDRYPRIPCDEIACSQDYLDNPCVVGLDRRVWSAWRIYGVEQA